MAGASPLKNALLRLVQPENALDSMVATFVGMVIPVRELQPKNA
jgi:hypothetical protein